MTKYRVTVTVELVSNLPMANVKAMSLQDLYWTIENDDGDEVSRLVVDEGSTEVDS